MLGHPSFHFASRGPRFPRCAPGAVSTRCPRGGCTAAVDGTASGPSPGETGPGPAPEPDAPQRREIRFQHGDPLVSGGDTLLEVGLVFGPELRGRQRRIGRQRVQRSRSGGTARDGTGRGCAVIPPPYRPRHCSVVLRPGLFQWPWLEQVESRTPLLDELPLVPGQEEFPIEARRALTARGEPPGPPARNGSGSRERPRQDTSPRPQNMQGSTVHRTRPPRPTRSG